MSEDAKRRSSEIVLYQTGARALRSKAGHLRMIIGCNEQTGELAISDSWGAWAAERWITVEEANSITQSRLMIIKW